MNAQRACFIGNSHFKLSTSSSQRISQLRLLGGQKFDRLRTRASDGSSTDTTETGDGSEVQLPSDSNLEAALEGNGKGQTESGKAVIAALEGKKVDVAAVENGSGRAPVYPSGDLVYKKKEGWEKFVVQCRMLFALPWQRVKKGSVLTIKLSGEVSWKSSNRAVSDFLGKETF